MKDTLHSSLVLLYRATEGNKGHWTERIDNAMQSAQSTIHKTNKLIGSLDVALTRHMPQLLDDLVNAEVNAHAVSGVHGAMCSTLVRSAEQLREQLQAFRILLQKDEEGR